MSFSDRSSKRLKIALQHVAELANHIGVASQAAPEVFTRMVPKRRIPQVTARVR